MSMRRYLTAALLPAAVLAFAFAPSDFGPPADATCHQIRGAETPDNPDDDVEVCEAEAYFHEGSTKIGNLGATTVDEYPSWDENAPGSYQDGNGAGYAAVLGDFLLGDSRSQPTFEGTFTGPMEELHVTAYVTSPLYEALLGTYPLEFSLNIDGTPVIVYNPAAGEEKDVPLTPHQGCDVPEVGIICSEMRFTITNLYQAMELNGIDVAPDAVHTITLSMNALYFGDSNGMFLYDAAEVPAGIDFNTLDAFSLATYDAVIGS